MQKSLNVFDGINTRLASFIQQSPSPFHTVEEITERLEENSFSFLGEQDPWKLEPGKGYFTTRNGSAVVAFKLPHEIGPDTPISFQIAATHTDSPSFKVKHVPTLKGIEGYLTLNVEGYGGMIDTTWLDRPLTLAGRVLARSETGIESRLVHFDRDLLLIPNLAVELDLIPHLSLSLPVYYSSWNYFVYKVKFRTLSVNPELRAWLRADNLGFFAAAHCAVAYYNFASGGDYRRQSHSRSTPAVGGGVNVGYRAPSVHRLRRSRGA